MYLLDFMQTLICLKHLLYGSCNHVYIQIITSMLIFVCGWLEQLKIILRIQCITFKGVASVFTLHSPFDLSHQAAAFGCSVLRWMTRTGNLKFKRYSNADGVYFMHPLVANVAKRYRLQTLILAVDSCVLGHHKTVPKMLYLG